MYTSVDIEMCRREGHRFQIVGSDKTPMKRSLRCVDCSTATRTDAYVAYGDDTKSWGQWRTPSVEAESDLTHHKM